MDVKKVQIRKAEKEDASLLHELIKGLAIYERRPQDQTGTVEQLSYWIFDRKIAVALIAEYENEAIGYAIYYPVFGSFSAVGKVHLEDLFIKKEYRRNGLGKHFLAKVAKTVLEDGYTEMEWSCLDWNEPAIRFYEKVKAVKETGRFYYGFPKKELEEMASLC